MPEIEEYGSIGTFLQELSLALRDGDTVWVRCLDPGNNKMIRTGLEYRVIDMDVNFGPLGGIAVDTARGTSWYQAERFEEVVICPR